MRVVWMPGAIADIRSIRDYIAQDSPSAAARLVDRILSRSEQIALFPSSGRAISSWDGRYRELWEGPYRIVYEIRNDGIEIFG